MNKPLVFMFSLAAVIGIGPSADALTPAQQKAVDEWVECLRSTAQRFAKQPDPAKAVAVAVFANCKAKERSLYLVSPYREHPADWDRYVASQEGKVIAMITGSRAQSGRKDAQGKLTVTMQDGNVLVLTVPPTSGHVSGREIETFPHFVAQMVPKMFDGVKAANAVRLTLLANARGREVAISATFTRQKAAAIKWTAVPDEEIRRLANIYYVNPALRTQ